MAIRKVIECDFCGEEVDGKYYIVRARDMDTLFNDLAIDLEKRTIICGVCRSRIIELLVRLNKIKKRKEEA